MTYSVLKYIVFLMCFGLSFYAVSSIQFDRFCSVRQPRKVIVLMFLLSFALAYISSQAILDLTIFNGFGG
ncbi:MAG: DUF1146 domain-containing protein [Erysipelotrichaceae bacterium]|jgi:uncharacterized membrane protein YwzB|nr:DUF1146 domain-containing protein [Erysipelotrichaceae bacterium]